MRYLIVFLAGALAGAAAALMLAPKSGSELRAQMSEEAARERERMRQGYESATQITHDNYSRMQEKIHRHLDDESAADQIEGDIEIDVEEGLSED